MFIAEGAFYVQMKGSDLRVRKMNSQEALTPSSLNSSNPEAP